MGGNTKEWRYRHTVIAISVWSLSHHLFHWASSPTGPLLFHYQATSRSRSQPFPTSTQQPEIRGSSRQGSSNCPVLLLYEEINPLSLFSVKNNTFMIRFYLLGERTWLLQILCTSITQLTEARNCTKLSISFYCERNVSKQVCTSVKK